MSLDMDRPLISSYIMILVNLLQQRQIQHSIFYSMQSFTTYYSFFGFFFCDRSPNRNRTQTNLFFFSCCLHYSILLFHAHSTCYADEKSINAEHKTQLRVNKYVAIVYFPYMVSLRTLPHCFVSNSLLYIFNKYIYFIQQQTAAVADCRISWLVSST